MAKFKVGDKVRLKRTGQVGTIFRVTTNFGFTDYWVKGLPGGPTDSPVYDEDLLELANSCRIRTTNPVVENALVSQLVNNSNHGVPTGWKVVKDGRDSWYGDYLALVQSESDPSKWTYFTSGKLGKPESKAEAEKDFKDFATRTYNSRTRKTVAKNAITALRVTSNAFKNTRLVPALESEVGELPDKMNRVVKKLKGDFSFWLQRDFIDGVESLIRTIDSSISSGEGDESEVKALKAMKPKLEKYRADAKSIMAKVNAI